MFWPRTPVLSRPGPFRPPCCPRPDCPSRQPGGPPFRYAHHATYTTRAQPHRRVHRLRCRVCDKTFSRKTFSVEYYLKRPDLLRPTAAALVAGSAHRQIARSLRCAPSTIDRLAQRLGRHCIRLLALALRQPMHPDAYVLDHFETFELTQDLPFGIATLVGRRSWFILALDPAPHARTGRISPAHKRRARRRRPTPALGGYPASFRRCLDLLLACRPGQTHTFHLATDDNPHYRRALARHPQRRRIRHRAYPNPPRAPKGRPRSPEARRRDRALFACDLLHALIRHSQAHHRRETIAFGRRLNAILERMFLLAVWRNFVKRRSERHALSPTPAMLAGLAREPWSWSRVLARRILPHEVALPPVWQRLYARDWPTPELGANTVHRPVHVT